MRAGLPSLLLAGLAALAACGPQGAPVRDETADQGEPEPETVDVPQTVTEMPEGTTPMPERVAVLGLLNKRNGIARELTLRPGQAIRVGDVVVRLRACETTAPWETQQLTGAFVQVDVRGTEGELNRVFSGWLYKESPSLNVVEHPIYDVWPKSCAMTHPGEGGGSGERAAAASSPSSAPQSAPPPPSAVRVPAPGAAPEESEPADGGPAAEPSADESN